MKLQTHKHKANINTWDDVLISSADDPLLHARHQNWTFESRHRHDDDIFSLARSLLMLAHFAAHAS